MEFPDSIFAKALRPAGPVIVPGRLQYTGEVSTGQTLQRLIGRQRDGYREIQRQKHPDTASSTLDALRRTFAIHRGIPPEIIN